MILGLTIPAWITIITILTAFVVMIRTSLPPSFVFVMAVAVLYMTRSISVDTALAGFASSAVVRVGVLFVVAAGLYWSGVLKWTVQHVLSYPKTYTRGLLKMAFPVALLSALMTDTTVVIIFTKIMSLWAKKLKISLSKLLIPMASIAEIGGILMIISATPSLVICSLYIDSTGKSMNIFDITLLASISLLVTIVVTLIFSRFIPSRTSPDENFEDTSEYTVELIVPSDCPDIGKTLEEANLFSIEDGHLVKIIRYDKIAIPHVNKNEFIMGQDRLIFAGKVDKIQEIGLAHGLKLSETRKFTLDSGNKQRQIGSAMVRYSSTLVGKKFANLRFEADNKINVLAISRRGQLLREAPRQVIIQGGDTVLFEYANNIREIRKKIRHEMIWTDVDDVIKVGPKTAISVAILLAMVVLSATGWLTILEATVFAAVGMILFGCCSIAQASHSIKWDVLMSFAASIVLGKAIEENGIARMLVDGIMSFSGGNVLITLFLVAGASLLVTELINNTAVAALFYPIISNVSVSMGIDLKALCLLLMLTASMAVATPIGTPTFTIIYGAGGYRFSDYLYLGIPLKIALFFTAVLSVYFIYL